MSTTCFEQGRQSGVSFSAMASSTRLDPVQRMFACAPWLQKQRILHACVWRAPTRGAERSSIAQGVRRGTWLAQIEIPSPRVVLD